MAPINLPDGTEVSEVILPDGSTASEVIAPDGSTVFSAIPDSAADHRHKFAEGSGTSTADSIGSATGTVNNANWITDSRLQGGEGLDGDGSLYVNIGTLGDFGSTHLPNYALAFTVETTSSDQERLLGLNDNNAPLVTINRSFSNHIEFLQYDDSGSFYRVAATDSEINDGSLYRVVINADESSSGVEIYITDENGNQSNETISVDSSATLGTINDFVGDIYYFARNNGGSAEQHYTGILDDVVWYTQNLSSSEVGSDYDLQPWSA